MAFKDRGTSLFDFGLGLNIDLSYSVKKLLVHLANERIYYWLIGAEAER